MITQNVDGLHAAAGSRDVINLHGDIATVVCLDCGDRSAGRELQRRLAELKSAARRTAACWSTPSCGRTVTRWSGTGSSFVLVGCLECGGRLKPDVVFFGESVPKARVERGVRAGRGGGGAGGARVRR